MCFFFCKGNIWSTRRDNISPKVSVKRERNGTEQSKNVSCCRNNEEGQAVSNFKVNIRVDC